MAKKYRTREERRKYLEAQKRAKGNKNSKGKTIFKRVMIVLAVIGIIGMLGGIGAFAYMIKDAPELDEKLLKDPVSSQVFDRNGKLVAEIGTEKRNYVEYENIPELVKNAVLAAEDVRFFEHHGVDYFRLASAVIANIRDGFGSQGGSTITQQLVKTSFLTPEKTLKRKVQEAWLAFQVEQRYTKEQIFEMYVNKNWMGSAGHGIATAAKTYFGKDLDELTLPEAATLAGILQSPANYDPFTNPDRAEKRRNIVLFLMHQHGFISEEEMKEAQAADLTASLVPEEQRKKGGIPYDSFIGHAIKEIKEKYPNLDPFSDGLKIFTTLDTNAQDYVDKLLNNGIVKFPNDKMQAGITLLDTKTGEILALGGGRNKTVTFGFNYATDAKRQPGSTFKPIFAYGPAIEYLKWGTYHVLEDKPYTYSDGTPINNWDNKHMGPMTIRNALALSRNIPALQATQAVGVKKAAEFAKNIGIELVDPQEAYSIGGVGGEDKGVSTLEMAGAYAAFGNNGFYTEPHAVTHIELPDGIRLNMKPETTLAMHDYTAFMVSNILKDVLRYGTGTSANIPGLPVAGKTGTTNYTLKERQKYKIPPGAVPDSWFVGYTTNYTIAVWVGYDNKFKNWLVGQEQRLPMTLFKNLMSHVSKNKRTPDFPMPNSVQKVRIIKGTMPPVVADASTPDDQVTIEYAVKGHAPDSSAGENSALAAPANFNAVYNPGQNQITLTWEHEDEDVEFELFVQKDGKGEQLLARTADKQYAYTPEGGGSYTFKLSAVKGGERSPAVSATVSVPGEDEPGGADDPDNRPPEPGNGHDGGNDDQNGGEPGQEPVPGDGNGNENGNQDSNNDNNNGGNGGNDNHNNGNGGNGNNNGGQPPGRNEPGPEPNPPGAQNQPHNQPRPQQEQQNR